MFNFKDDDDQNEDEEKPTQSDDSNSNLESVASKSKSNFNEFEENAETMEGGEDTMDDDDEDDDENSRMFGGAVTAGDKTKSELNNQLNKLLDELAKIQEERKRREIEIEPINNPVLKAHLSSRLRVLLDEENKKRNEIEEIKSRIE